MGLSLCSASPSVTFSLAFVKHAFVTSLPQYPLRLLSRTGPNPTYTAYFRQWEPLRAEPVEFSGVVIDYLGAFHQVSLLSHSHSYRTDRLQLLCVPIKFQTKLQLGFLVQFSGNIPHLPYILSLFREPNLGLKLRLLLLF